MASDSPAFLQYQEDVNRMLDKALKPKKEKKKKKGRRTAPVETGDSGGRARIQPPTGGGQPRGGDDAVFRALMEEQQRRRELEEIYRQNMAYAEAAGTRPGPGTIPAWAVQQFADPSQGQAVGIPLYSQGEYPMTDEARLDLINRLTPEQVQRFDPYTQQEIARILGFTGGQ